MSEENGGSKVAFFFAGLGIGAILALLFAPRSGEEARRYISGKAEEGKDYLSSKARQLREQAGDLVEKGKDRLTQEKERFADALESYKQGSSDKPGSSEAKPRAR